MINISLSESSHRCGLNFRFSLQTKKDEQHKVTRDNGMDENEILRIPLTVAMVKLIKELPHNAVNTHLPR